MHYFNNSQDPQSHLVWEDKGEKLRLISLGFRVLNILNRYTGFGERCGEVLLKARQEDSGVSHLASKAALTERELYHT